MKLATISGTIERRLLVNFRVDPGAAERVVPEPFEPVLVDGWAIAGICLIQLRVRPTWLPERIGFSSTNGAHRVSVRLPDGRRGVYVPRRDTNSRLSTLIGGRLFPGRLHRANIEVEQSGDQLAAELTSRDGTTHVSLSASVADSLTETSVFGSVGKASDFFEQGAIGYSDAGPGSYDGVELRTVNWSVTPLDVHHVESSFFDNETLFPPGTAELDNALLMRDIRHAWHSLPQMKAS